MFLLLELLASDLNNLLLSEKKAPEMLVSCNYSYVRIMSNKLVKNPTLSSAAYHDIYFFLRFFLQSNSQVKQEKKPFFTNDIMEGMLLLAPLLNHNIIEAFAETVFFYYLVRTQFTGNYLKQIFTTIACPSQTRADLKYISDKHTLCGHHRHAKSSLAGVGLSSLAILYTYNIMG